MHRRIAGALAGAAALALAAQAVAATPIAGFEETTVAGQLGGVVGLDFAPDGRIFFVEKAGRLRVIEPGGTVKTLLSKTDVASNGDRGLTGIAVDADFAHNGFVYLLYTYDATGLNMSGPKETRLSRVKVNPDDTLASPGAPETIILGTYSPTINEACPAASNTNDCVPADGLSHVGGTVRAAPDGTLFVGTGDGRYAASNNPPVTRPQDETSYAGKILHVDRNGKGLPGHAFCPADTNLAHVCTKVYAKGFRNPFRFEPDPSGHSVVAGDVGESTWEELDRVVSGGNYGWPCYEGPDHYAPNAGNATCTALYAKEGTASAARGAIRAYRHQAGSGAAIIGGPVWTSSTYPSAYRGRIFYGDFDLGWLDSLELDGSDNVVASHPFASGWQGTDLRQGPDGALYSSNYLSITRFVPAGGNRHPTAVATGDPPAGPAPLTVVFDGTSSTDPDGDALAYHWDFGDGASADGATVSHTYAADGRYSAALTVTDPGGLDASATVPVLVGDHPPQLTVTAPADGDTYVDGRPVALHATATDAEDGPLPGSAIRWHIRLHHNEHEHVLEDAVGSDTSFTPLVDHGADSFYILDVSVADSEGIVTTRTVTLTPQLAPVSLTTDPGGVTGSVSFANADHPFPFSAQQAVGYRTPLVAPVSVTTGDGQKLAFRGWSDGGDQWDLDRDLIVPADGIDLRAAYRPDVIAPDTKFKDPSDATTSTHYATFTLWTSEPNLYWECAVDDTTRWERCSTPWRPGPLANGAHKVYARSVDWVGNVDPTPASRQVVVATTS